MGEGIELTIESVHLTTIWTIDHSTRTLAEFIEALHPQEIGAVADVRKLPGSRRFPHFDQESLQPELARVGIANQHFPDLGWRVLVLIILLATAIWHEGSMHQVTREG